MECTGNLLDMCKFINSEYGSDSKIVLQLYNDNGDLINGDYCIKFGYLEDGTLVLTNKK